MVQAANSIEMLARKNCASILLAYESTAQEKRSTTASSGGRRYLSPFERLYKCKDCDRTFDSFQALGGHRASHMKLRLPHQLYSETIDHTPDGDDRDGMVVAVTRRPMTPMRVKAHECRQCLERFPTGQALGGHMRKHAELMSGKRKRQEEGSKKKGVETFRVVEESDKKRQRVVLQLDLNFPPVDELTSFAVGLV